MLLSKHKLNPAYIAGLVDGEGSLSLKCGSKSYVMSFDVSITNTNDLPLRLIQKEYGGEINSRKRKAKWKVSHELKLPKRNLESFLTSILPYLIIKRPQAELMLEAISHGGIADYRGKIMPQGVRKYRESLIAKAHEYNKRGA